MIDANSQFFAILTTVGRAKQANADALGLPWKITEMGVGDANDTDPIPTESQTRLINEWRRRPLNQLRVDPVNAAVIIAEQIIPADEGGRWIREIGLYDADGDLVAVANCAPSFKPMLSQGSGRTQVVRMNFIVASTGNITLKIDPAVVLATREYVDAKILEELYKLDSKQSVRVATSANIALAGLQTIDTVALGAGDRVLVKNQTVAKDNGLYLAAVGVWARALDADTNTEVTSALLVSVEQGALLADTRWQLITDGVIVLGTTALTFQNVTQGFAPINSPALQGVPTASTPPLFDNSLKLATTEFVQRALGNHAALGGLNANVTLTSANTFGMSYILNSVTPFTVKLPLGSTSPNGGVVTFTNVSTAPVTLTLQGADYMTGIAGVGAGGSVVLGQRDTITLSCAGGNTWYAEDGSVRDVQSAALKSFVEGPNGLTAPQFASDLKFATTEFVQRAIGSFGGGGGGITVSRQLTAADLGKRLELAAGVTVTLPDSSTVPNGSAVLISAGPTSTTSRVTVGAGELLGMNNLSVPVPYTLAAGGDFIAIKEGSAWRCHFGSEPLRTSPLFAASLSVNGYQKLPSGLIEQWGTIALPVNVSTSPVAITFPIAFPTAAFQVVAGTGVLITDYDSSPSYRVGHQEVSMGVPTLTGCEGQAFIDNYLADTRSVCWRALGK